MERRCDPAALDALPENMILASNVVPIVSSDIAEDVTDVIDGISAELSAEDLVDMNVQSTVDQKSSAEITTAWLKEKGPI